MCIRDRYRRDQILAKVKGNVSQDMFTQLRGAPLGDSTLFTVAQVDAAIKDRRTEAQDQMVINASKAGRKVTMPAKSPVDTAYNVPPNPAKQAQTTKQMFKELKAIQNRLSRLNVPYASGDPEEDQPLPQPKTGKKKGKPPKTGGQGSKPFRPPKTKQDRGPKGSKGQ